MAWHPLVLAKERHASRLKQRPDLNLRLLRRGPLAEEDLVGV